MRARTEILQQHKMERIWHQKNILKIRSNPFSIPRRASSRIEVQLKASQTVNMLTWHNF